jgi:hypothetical protein
MSWTENRHHWRAQGRRYMHRTAVVADQKVALLKQCRHFSQCLLSGGNDRRSSDVIGNDFESWPIRVGSEKKDPGSVFSIQPGSNLCEPL